MIRSMVLVLSLCILFIYGCSVHTSFRGQDDKTGSNDADANKVDGGAAPPVTVEGVGKYAQQEDKFDQSQKGVLDILLVIDNSISMIEEQDELATNLPALLEYVEKSDWQIAVISTTMNECLSARITKRTHEYKDVYSRMVNLGTLGSGMELYFYQAIQGLKGRCNNTTTSWLRNNSTVAVLIVGDEGNYCDGYANLLPIQTCKSSDLSAHLNLIRPNGNAKVYGLIPSPSEWQVEVATDPTVLSIFAAYGSIHDTSYAGTLQKISQNVQTVLGNVFTLSQEPSGAVNVVVNGKALTSVQYTIDVEGKQLKFNMGYVPPEKATIVVSYRYLIK